jgi:hypothetical protein
VRASSNQRFGEELAQERLRSLTGFSGTKKGGLSWASHQRVLALADLIEAERIADMRRLAQVELLFLQNGRHRRKAHDAD